MKKKILAILSVLLFASATYAAVVPSQGQLISTPSTRGIVISGSTPTSTLSSTTTCPTVFGCTGTSTVPALGQVLVGQSNGTYAPQATSTLGISGGVSSVTNSDGSLTISPTTGGVVASLNTAHTNTWSVGQLFNSVIQAKQYATDATTIILANFGSSYYWSPRIVGSDFNIQNNFGAMPLTILAANNRVGISTTTPGSLLTVAGDLAFTGALKTKGDAGSSGYVLQSTGSGANWVATSSLGISGGGGGSPGGADNTLQYKASTSTFGGLLNSVVNSVSGFLGLGVTPSYRLHVKADSTTLTTPSGFSATPHTETLANAPTIATTEVDGPADSTSAAVSATQVDGAGSYFADGSTNINYYVYAYKTIAGVNYFTGTASNYFFTDNSDFSNFSNTLNWSAVTGADGYVVQATGSAGSGNPNWTLDVGNVLTFNDDGAQSGSFTIPSNFNSIAFYPQPTPNANDPNTLNATQNSGGSGYTATGNNIQYSVYAYDNTGVITYYSNTPATYSFTDNSDGNPYQVDLTWNSGGSQSGFKVLKIVNGGMTEAVDVGNVTSYSDTNFTGGDTTVGPPVSSFTPSLTRSYSAYGYLTSPTTHYSASPYSYTFTDTAPSTGYVILHTVTYGSGTPNIKILGSYTGQTLTSSYSTTAGTFYETAAPSLWTGDTTVTPVHYGFVSSGQTVGLKFYAHDTTPFSYYSSSALTGSYVFPNDSVYRYFTVNYTANAGSGTRVLRDTGSGYGEYVDFTGTGAQTFDYTSTDPVWTSGSTVTPNTVEGTAALFESAAQTTTDAPQVIIKSTATGGGATNAMRLDFRNAADSTVGSIGIDPNQLMKFYSSGSTFDFSVPSIGLISRLNSSATTLNVPFVSNYYFQVNKGSSGTMFKVLSNASAKTRAFLGNDTTDTFGAALAITPDGSTDEGIFVNSRSASGVLFRGSNTVNGSTGIIITAAGKIALNRSIIGSGLITLGPGDSSNPQITFDDSATVSTNVGGLTRKTSDGGLRYTYVAGTPTRIITDTGTDITSNFIPKIGSFGSQIVASGIKDDGSIVSFPTAESALFQNGLSISSSKNLTMAGGSAYVGGLRTTIGSVSATTNLSVSNHSPIVEFTGSTSGRTLTLPTAASISGTVFQIFNRASVSVQVLTTSSQNINISGTTTTSLTLQPGDSVKFIATAASTWDAVSYSQSGFTTGSVLFAGSIGTSQNNANFFWDNTNKSLGIGTSGATTTLTVKGQPGSIDLFSTASSSGSIFYTIYRDGAHNFAAITHSLALAIGDFWHDATQKVLSFYNGSNTVNLPGVLFTQSAQKVVANTASETTMLGSGVGTTTLGSNFWVAGKTIHIAGKGVYGTKSVLPGNVTINVKLGATTLASATANALITSASKAGWSFDEYITCQSISSNTCTFSVGGGFNYAAANPASTNLAQLFADLNNNGDTVTASATTSQAINVSLTWATADAANIATTTTAVLEVKN